MIGDRILAKMGKSSIKEVYAEVAAEYLAGRVTAARDLLLKMSKNQLKHCLMFVHSLYPNDSAIIRFILNFI